MAENDDKLGLNEEQKGAINQLSPMEQFAFYQGVSRGVLMVLNTMMIKHAGCTLQQWQHRMIKEKIKGIVAVQDVLDLLGALVVETQKLTEVFRQKASLESETKKESANDNTANKQ